MEKKSTLVEKAEEEFWRLFNKNFGLVGNSGDSRATAAYLAKIFNVGDVNFCIDTAIKAYKSGRGYAFITSEGLNWLDEGIIYMEKLRKSKKVTSVPDRYLEYLQDREVLNRVTNER